MSDVKGNPGSRPDRFPLPESRPEIWLPFRSAGTEQKGSIMGGKLSLTRNGQLTLIIYRGMLPGQRNPVSRDISVCETFYVVR